MLPTSKQEAKFFIMRTDTSILVLTDTEAWAAKEAAALYSTSTYPLTRIYNLQITLVLNSGAGS